MNGTTMTSTVSLSGAPALSAPWKIVGAGDFNGDTHPDLLFWNPTTGNVAVWYLNGTTYLSAANTVPNGVADTTWVPVAVGDFDHDNQPDIVWWQKTTGVIGVWYMNGITQRSAANFSASPVTDLQWHPIAVADFNHDGYPDVFWQHYATGGLAIWYMVGATKTGGANPPGITDLNWKVVGLGDFNADTNPDLVWKQVTPPGNIGVWFMNSTGSATIGTGNTTPLQR
jgi:hypothetical protein